LNKVAQGAKRPQIRIEGIKINHQDIQDKTSKAVITNQKKERYIKVVKVIAKKDSPA